MAKELTNINLKEVSYVSAPAHKKAKVLFFKARGEGRGVGGSAQGDGNSKYCVCSECGYSEKHVKTGEGKSIPCTKVKCPECGMLMQGSDTKTLKKKKKINIVIDSDGTIGGTKISVNGDELEDLRDFNFSFWSNADSSNPVSCSYSKFVETEDGFSRSETFYLSKGDLQMDEKIKKQLENYFGENENIDFEKAEDDSVIIKALETVNEYRGDFPDDLKKAVGVIAKQTGLHESADTKQSDNETDLEKAGAKLSKETLKKITDALVALKSILPQLKENTEKSDKTDVEKSIKELTESIEKLEKKKEDATKDELTEALAELAKRLETVEKNTGVAKNISGQDDETGDGDKKWPSLG